MMPVAVRLSRNFYDRFGDEATNELVTLLNDVNLTNRSELKDAFGTSLSVFDEKLERRLAQTVAQMEKRLAETVAQIDANVDRRFREERLEARFAAIDVQFAEVRGEMKGLQSHLVRWMFGFWVASTLTIVGALIALR
jgi:hypothetical protein